MKIWDLSGNFLAKFPASSELSAVCRAPAELVFAGGTKTGDLYLLKACGIDPPPPLVTLKYLFRYRYKDFSLTGTWDREPGVRCPWCAKWFTPPADVVERVQKRGNQSQQLAECAHCHLPMKFNTFVIDNRDRG